MWMEKLKTVHWCLCCLNECLQKILLQKVAGKTFHSGVVLVDFQGGVYYCDASLDG